jgi:hypothetical protein
MRQLNRRGKYRNAEDAAEDLTHSRWREKAEATYQGIRRQGGGGAATCQGRSRHGDADQRSKDGRRALAELRQKQAETIEAINAWQHEQWPENATKEELDARATCEFPELNGKTGDKVERKIAGNMRHRPTVYRCLMLERKRLHHLSP